MIYPERLFPRKAIHYSVYHILSEAFLPPARVGITTHLVSIKSTLKIQDVLHVFRAALTLVDFLGDLAETFRNRQQR